jgi:hypothetical protein
MTNKQRTYHLLSSARTPRRVLHLILYHLLRKQAMATALPKSRNKNAQLKNRLSNSILNGQALCLLKTQFAKKPKNPV